MKSFLAKAKSALENSEALHTALEQAKQAAAPALEQAKEAAKAKAEEALKSLGETLKEKQASLQSARENATPVIENALETATAKTGETLQTLGDKARTLFEKLPDPATFKLPPLPLDVSEARLNALAAGAITDDSRIKSLTLRCEQDILTVSGALALAGLPLTFSTRLALESCELSPTRKVIVLRRLDTMALGGEGMAAAFMAHLVKILICGLFGVDLGAISLKNIQGLTIDKALITADLEAMGAMTAINKGLQDRIRQGVEMLPAGPLAKLALEPILGLAGNALLERLQVRGVALQPGRVMGELVLGKG